MEEKIPVANEMSTSQRPAIEVLQKLGYKYISEEENKNLRSNILTDVIFKDILAKKLNEINSYEYKGEKYKFSASTIGQAIKDLNEDLVTGLISTNEKIYDLLTLGKSYQENMVDGTKRSFDIKYIDFEHPENNEFYVTEEFSVLRMNGKDYARPDIVLFINGIPLAVIECKDASVPIIQAISQNIRNQKPDYIPQLFKFIQIVMAANKNETKYATCGTPDKFWSTWNEQYVEKQNELLNKTVIDRQITKQDRDIISLFEKERFLELIKDFIIFEAGKKKICRYQQYFAVKAMLERIKNDKKGGVVWHTQGSGKSITMVYITKKLMEDKGIQNPQVVIATDRVDLDKQIHKTFNRIGVEAARATTGNNLTELIKNEKIRVITTVINKFETVVKSGISVDAPNTFILVDEGHRTQYGEINRRMQEVFKGAIYISFTGTPIMKKDKNIFDKFGGLIHKYSLDDALKDKAIVPLIYEGKMVDQEVSREVIDMRLDMLTRNLTEEQKMDVMKKWSRFEKVASSEQRLELIAWDIASNYNQTLKGTGFNSMLACNKKVEAVKYYNIFKDEFPELEVAVVISPPDMREGEGSIDEDTNDIVKKFYINAISNYKNEEEYEETIKSKFINGDIDILIVVDKLLTGFDAPKASTLYLDKQIKEHNLLQAIARVNRLCDGKDYGYIVDYRGLLGELDKALTMYQEAGLEEFNEEDIKSSVYYIDTEINNMFEAYEELKELFKNIKNKNDLEEYEIFLENEKIRKDFYNKLCKFGSMLGIILPSDQAYYKVGKEKISELRKALAFYQKLRATVKLRYSETIDHKEYEAKMQKLLDNYVVAKEMMRITEPVDITDAENFDKELEKMGTDRGKADSIRTRLTRTISEKSKEDPAYYKKFSTRIEETIEEYRNRRITDSEYLQKMQDIKEDFRKGNSGISYPTNITTENSRAFYGVIYDKLIPRMKENANIEEIGEIALTIQREIESKIKRDWHYNTDIHNEIAQAIDDTIFMYATRKNINLDLEELDKLIEEIINIALMKY
ncbi:MAG: type I restriction endonuclease subunit R [Clostridia bacterium]|nr:type I restriction endonuclease subunit R [Clostridia bacterium]